MDEKNNSKQEPNPFDEKPPKKPKDGMKKKLRLTRRTVSALYLGIAVCMVAVLTVSLVSTNNKIDDSIGDINDLSISVPDISISVPDISRSDEVQTGQNVSGVTDDIVKPVEKNDPVTEPTYCLPAVGNISKGYYSDTLVFSETMQDYRTHSGVDITTEAGAKVKAYTDGTVSKVTDDPFMGTTVEITHKAGVVSVYKNLSTNPDVAVGDTVKAGDTIGIVGQTALIEIAEQPHLHFELWMNGECINSEKELLPLMS